MGKRFKQVLKIAMLVLLFGFTNVMYAQRTVTGTVKDAKDGSALPGVNVTVKGVTGVGTVTNIDGKFSIAVPSDGNTLVFSFVGYTSQEVALNAQTNYEIMLEPSTQELEEVVVTALGIRREQKAIGYAITEVKGEEITKANTVNPVAALQGKAAGVSIGGSDGGSYGGYKIQIRGVNTLGSNNQPIFVVDGVIMDNATSGNDEWGSGTGDWGNELKNLNPDDFESVTILKGAAATALYGSRGLNGAVVITTKQAKASKTLGISVSQTFGMDWVYATPKLQNEYGPGIMAGYVNYYAPNAFDVNQFMTQTVNGVEVNTLIGDYGLSWGPKFDNSQIYGYDHQMTEYKAYKNNFKDAYEKGFFTNTNIAIQGGNDVATFYISDSYKKQNGYYPGNDFSRNSFLLKGTYKPIDRIQIEGSVSYVQSNPKNPLGSMGEYFATGYIPRTYDTKKYKKMYTADHGGVPSTLYGDEWGDIPATDLWFSINNNNYSRIENTIRPTFKFSADITDWFRASVEGNMNLYNYKAEEKNLGSGYMNEGGSYKVDHFRKEQKTGKLTLSFHKNINDFSLSFMTGGEIFKTGESQSYIQTNGGLVVPGQFFIKNSKNTITGEGKITGTKQINSIYYIFNGSWKDQLFLDITGRNDWSSALVYSNGTGNYSYFYPSISSSWLFTKTFELPSWVSFGKLRLSWAQVGNDTEAYFINKAYTLESTQQNDGYIYRNIPSNVLVDPSLKPERKNSIEFGTDIRFFNNRLGIDFAYYKENVKDQILQIPAPKESGVSSQLINAGNIENKGVEIVLTGTPIKTTNLSWDVTFNYGKNWNKIVDLHKDVGKYKLLAGYPDYGNYRVGSVAWIGGEYGVLLSDALPLRDADGNKVLTYVNSRRGAYHVRSGEIQKVGSVLPKFEGSISNTFNYKGIELSFMLDMRFGGYLTSYSNRYGLAYGFTGNSLDYRDAEHGGITWTSAWDGVTYHDGMIPDGVFAANTMVAQPNGSSINVGGMTYQQAYEAGYVEPTHVSYYTYREYSWGTGVVDDKWVSEINYIALRQLSLGYNFPQSLCTRMGVKGLRVAMEAHNLAYLYNSLPNKLNPESTRGNRSDYSYFERYFTPYVATYALNLKINF